MFSKIYKITSSLWQWMKTIWAENAMKQWGSGYSVQLLKSQKNLKPVVVLLNQSVMPLKVTAAAPSVHVHSISVSHCHFLKSQITFTSVDSSALIIFRHNMTPLFFLFILFVSVCFFIQQHWISIRSFCFAHSCLSGSYPITYGDKFTETMLWPEMHFCCVCSQSWMDWIPRELLLVWPK